MNERTVATLVLVIVGLTALFGLWTVLGYDFSDGKVPQVHPGKAFLYPEHMKITQEITPEENIRGDQLIS